MWKNTRGQGLLRNTPLRGCKRGIECLALAPILGCFETPPESVPRQMGSSRQTDSRVPAQRAHQQGSQRPYFNGWAKVY